MNTINLTIIILSAMLMHASEVFARDVPIHGKSSVHFASLDEAAAIVTAQDQFIEHLSRFDLQSRMKTDREVTKADYLKFVAQEVVAWERGDVDKVTAVIESIRDRLEGFRIPFPDTIQLVKSTGKEEGDAAYCRGTSIVLPVRMIQKSRHDLERLLIHELFHIASRHSPDFRRRMYAIIGFKPCKEIEFPKTLSDRRITNPDSPTIDYYIELEINGKATKAVPILYSSTKQYDAKAGQPFFRYLVFRMMVVEKNGDKWQAVERDKVAVVFDPKKLPAYFEKIGKNTNYVIHPDEILADNFVHLVTATEPLATPRIIEQMRKLSE